MNRLLAFTKKVLVLTIVFISYNSFACLSASQNRLFPIGMTSKGLCVLETRLFRTELSGENKTLYDEVKLIPGWGGITYLKFYNAKREELESQIIDQFPVFDEKFYLEKIESSYQKAIEIAANHKDFIPAETISFKTLDFKQKSKHINLNYDIKNNKVNLLLDKLKYTIKELFIENSIAGNILHKLSGYDDLKINAKLFKNALLLNSVRTFKIGNKTLTVIHIAYGDSSFLPTNDTPELVDMKANFKNKKLTQTIFEEPVVHHGCGFDFFVLT